MNIAASARTLSLNIERRDAECTAHGPARGLRWSALEREKPMQRMLSISGLRGVVGDGLDPVYVTRFASALGTLAEGGTIIVTRDGRVTGPMLKQAVTAGLTACGCRVLDGGIASTPTCGVLVVHHRAAGGLQITASHNPIEWNGLKPFSRDGSVFDESIGRRFAEILDSEAYRFARWDTLGGVERIGDPSVVHLERVLARVDLDAILSRKFKVVLDCNHGSGCILGPRLLEMLGCEVHVLGGEPDGKFEHPAEPIEDHLGSLCAAVRENRADVGFALDPDADRLAIVDETGRYIGEELTVALCADQVLARTPGPIVVNASSSRATADIAGRHGCPFHRSPVGEANVVSKMKSVSAILGGEGNGGVIEPAVGYVRDSFVGMAYVLAGIAARKQPLSLWVDSLPKYAIVKDKVTCPRERAKAASAALQKAYPDASRDESDGLRLDWEDGWVHVRASNTEPIVRVIAEAPDREAARAHCARAVEIVRDAAGGAPQSP